MWMSNRYTNLSHCQILCFTLDKSRINKTLLPCRRYLDWIIRKLFLRQSNHVIWNINCKKKNFQLEDQPAAHKDQNSDAVWSHVWKNSAIRLSFWCIKIFHRFEADFHKFLSFFWNNIVLFTKFTSSTFCGSSRRNYT